MGANTSPEHEISAWLRSGGIVVAASERTARSLTASYNRARRAEGLEAWPAPAIHDWQSFLRTAAENHPAATDGRLLLDSLQEQSIWAEIVGSDRHMATLLEGPRNRMARLAADAHKLLCSYAPQFLRESARASWQQDAENFSAWLAAFEATCRSANVLSPPRLPLELIPLLEDSLSRAPLLLTGFDRILPTQRRLFDAWGQWQEAPPSTPAREVRNYHSPDTQSELAACALWCRQHLTSNPSASLLVVTQGLSERRGEIERAFLNFAATGNSATPNFEFSLGIPLAQVPLARGAYLLLRWLSGPIAESELDWLLSTGQIAAEPQESIALQSTARAFRRRGLERPSWTLKAFLAAPSSAPLPQAWVTRIVEAQSRLASVANRPQSPLEWAEFVPQLLQTTGWPGARPLTSQEHQARKRWEQTVESCASLGFDGRRIRWPQFLSLLASALQETLFSPESHDAPIQIAGPAESAGLTADAIWFLGVSEVEWPSSGATHPLLPPAVQRDASMPHATARLDWELARAISLRLLHSAPQVNFSYARQSDGVETRASRIVTNLAGTAQPIPAELTPPAAPQPLTVLFEDSSRIPFPPGKVEGGAGVLTHQSQCPFKAFATARLAAQSWQPAEPGLSASQRGNLLHAVLHSIWGNDPPIGIRTLQQLQSLPDRTAFVAGHVARALQQKLPNGIRDRMPRRYLELEEQRLVRLVTEWLNYESTRIEFEVTATEADRTISLAGLTFDLRLDRIDRLNDSSLLVIDYKTGQVSPKSWQLPRPDDVQLPLYAGFAIREDEVLGGLVFAKVRSGNQSFAGHVGDPKATLLPDLTSTSSLVKNKFDAEMLLNWREAIEQLAHDFLSGRAEVDPRDYPKTCEYCGLESLCRIAENRTLLDPDELPGEADTEAADE
jgi:ATP-dependent helicase/nuclease subunit B